MRREQGYFGTKSQFLCEKMGEGGGSVLYSEAFSFFGDIIRKDIICAHWSERAEKYYKVQKQFRALREKVRKSVVCVESLLLLRQIIFAITVYYYLFINILLLESYQSI